MLAVKDFAETESPGVATHLVIFDFDGTLADTLGEALEVVNSLAPKYGFAPIDPDLAAELRNLDIRDAIRRVGLPARRVPRLLLEIRRAMHDRLTRVDPIPGIPEALAALRRAGASLGIVTSNSERNVTPFLERTGLRAEFDFVAGSTSLFGKARRLRAILASRTPQPAGTIVYVGDEVRDIQAARRVGIRAAAVLWGAHTRPLLARHSPDWILESPHDLERLLAAG